MSGQVAVEVALPLGEDDPEGVAALLIHTAWQALDDVVPTSPQHRARVDQAKALLSRAGWTLHG